MKKLAITLTLLCTAALAQPERHKVEEAGPLVKFIPDGYKFFDVVHGDLNGDGIDDYVLIIRATDKKNFYTWDKVYENCSSKESVDGNPRGIMVFFGKGNDYQAVTECRKCLAPENACPPYECGGSCYNSDEWAEIAKGNLYINSMSKGLKLKYTFKYRNSKFELIGFDTDNPRPISINYLSKKKLEIDPYCNNCKKPKETWSNITVKEPILLQEGWNTKDWKSYIGLED